MFRKAVAGALLVMWLCATCAAQGPGAAETKVPDSLQQVTGNRVVSYVFFLVLAGLGLLVIFRGVRAR